MSLADIIPFGRKIELLTDEDIASIADLANPRPLLDRAASAVTDVLQHGLSEETRLVGLIRDLTEELRQVRLVIDAFAPVPDKLVNGSEPLKPIKATLKSDPVDQPKRKARA